MLLSDRIKADATGPPRPSANSLEIQRIVSLPIRGEITPEEVEEISRMELQAHHFDAGARLFEPQAKALVEWATTGGILGPIAAGEGKTLLLLLIASHAYREGHNKILLVVPIDVYNQLVLTDIPWARDRIDMSVPVLFLGRKHRAERAYVANSKRKGCYIMPYSCLSTADSWDLLTGIAPTLILLDEVHCIKNLRSARTQRIMSYIKQAQPKVVGVSGTITDKSIADYHHIASVALGENSPLPLNQNLAMEWAAILDADATPSEANAGPIKPLMEWAARNFPDQDFPATADGFRKAYRYRLNTCPGVVSTGNRGVGTSLVYSNIPVAEHTKVEGWKRIEELISGVTDDWQSPSGDEIAYAIHMWAYLVQLHSGFYYHLFWPDVDGLAERRGWSRGEAEEMLDIAKRHHARLQIYDKYLREFFKHGHFPGLDTPMLVGKHLSICEGVPAPVPLDTYEAWLEVKELDFPELPERDRTPVRICPFKADAAVAWAKRIVEEEGAPGGLIWVAHQEMGFWVSDLLVQAGLPSLHCPADSERPGSDAAIRDPANRDKFIVASIKGHGRGKNLQHHQHMFYAQWSKESTDAEQTVARIHRRGQLADRIRVDTCNTTEFDFQNFAACLVDALYQHQTLGARQRIIYGTHDPLPKIYPSAFLRENGFQNRLLDAQGEREMKERFLPR